MPKLDTPGTYRGEITESSLGSTKKGYPQFLARIKISEKYVETPADLAHFTAEGVIDEARPQWVDWASFDEDILGYFVLFNDPDTFSDDTKLLNYEQLQLALGWDGTEFDSLNNDTYSGKKVLIRVEESEYDGQTRLSVNWIDDFGATPNRELKKLDSAEVSKLGAKLKIKGKNGPKRNAAKPKRSAVTATTPAASRTDKPGPVAEPVAEPVIEELTMEEAWANVCDAKGDHTDVEVEDAWIAGIESVSPDREETSFTPQEWWSVQSFARGILA